jgi:octaprenyl-diphosphate synthase
VSVAAPAAAADDGEGTALDRLTALLADDLAAVNQTIVDRMDSPVELIPRLAGYIVASGGKRLRPLLTLAAARMCGHEGRRHVGLATAVEFIHTATLLHDDVVDESDLRRGQASANEVFGNQPSVLVGDFLFARAFQLMVEDGSIDVLRTLSDASATIAEGEVLQLSASHDTATTEEVYLRVVRAKTAELFAAACAVGGLVAGRTPAEVEALTDFGANLGMAFQLVDDVLDYSALQARLGKTVGDDFNEGKITLPVVLAIARGDGPERAFWRRTLEEGGPGDGDLTRAIAILESRDCLADSIGRARVYGDAARRALSGFPDHPIKTTLLDVVTFCIERDY